MSTNGRIWLERAGKIISFIAAWAIVGHQVWRTQYGQEPSWILMVFAASILVPTAVQYLLAGRGVTVPSVSVPSSPSPSSSGSGSDSGGS